MLPEYQGIGIGRKFLSTIAHYYTSLNFEFKITTSAKNMIITLNGDKDWRLSRYSKSSPQRYGGVACASSTRTNCRVASFFYIGG